MCDALSLQGDVHETFYDIEREVGMPDYLFLDSWHSHTMGNFYSTEVLPKFTKHTYVSLHDVHNPTFWGDDRDDPSFREVSPCSLTITFCRCHPSLSEFEHICIHFCLDLRALPGPLGIGAVMNGHFWLHHPLILLLRVLCIFPCLNW